MNTIDEKKVEVYFWHKITTKGKALLYEHLANLIDGGVTVVDALYSFLEKTNNPKLYKEIQNLLLFIESGDSFSISMKKLPYTFDKKEIAIVEAGESSGTMQRSFSSLARQLHQQEDLKAKVKGALTYPIIILVFLIFALFVIMIYVIPKLRPLFETTGVELPFSTRTLIYTSEFFSNNIVAIIFVIFIGFLALKIYRKSYSGKRVFDDLFLNLPLIGDVYRNYIISQISSNLGLLIGAGIPIIKTLKLTGESSNNAIYIEAMEMIANSVASGNKITQSIENIDPRHKYFTNDFIQMISAGEKTSTINKVCDKISTQYTREVDNSIGILVKWIEPLAIAIAGTFVLWFAFSIFAAVIKITELVG
ncbi:type II secretion system F family protein [Candidatus Gracilibacteria bacterium]|nr:type II secretion system F family protein [Candidatus Gracilibacteria bacterium]